MPFYRVVLFFSLVFFSFLVYSNDVTDQFLLFKNSNGEVYLHAITEDSNLSPGIEIDWLNSDNLKLKYKLQPQYDDYILGLNMSNAIPQERGSMSSEFLAVENYKVLSGELDNRPGVDFLVWIETIGIIIFSPHQDASIYKLNTNNYDASINSIVEIIDINSDGLDDVVLGGNGSSYQMLNAGGNQLSAPTLMSASETIGSIPSKFSISATGAVNYQVPLEMVPGINGMQPSLSLNYNSRGGNGVMGVGWSLGGTSMVHRCGSDYVHDGEVKPITLTSSDNRCLNGQRIIDGRTEIDSFNKISEITGGYEVFTKNGLTKHYTHEVKLGSTAYQWLLKTVTDKFGNEIFYNYVNEGSSKGHALLTSIEYPGGKVTIGYSRGRHDMVKRYLAGNEIYLAKLLNSISIYSINNHQSKLVRKYTLNFPYYSDGQSNIATANNENLTSEEQVKEISPSTKRTLLYAIDMCAFKNGIFESCLPSLTFDWLSNIISEPQLSEASDETSTISKMIGAQPFDYNGDGKKDLLLNSYQEISVLLNNGVSLDSSLELVGDDSKYVSSVIAVDLNNDGQDEIIYRDASYIGDSSRGKIHKQKQQWKIKEKDGNAAPLSVEFTLESNGRDVFGIWQFEDFYPGMNAISAPQPLVLDINGDGLQDLIVPVGGYWKAYRNTSTSTSISFSAQSGNFIADNLESVPAISYAGRSTAGIIQLYLHNADDNYELLNINSNLTTSSTRTTTNIETEKTIVLDVNGDGYQDIVGATEDDKVALYLNNSGTLQAAVETEIPSRSVLPEYENSFSFKRYPTKPTDINNDGLSDLVYLDNGMFKCLRSTGEGFEQLDLNVAHGGTLTEHEFEQPGEASNCNSEIVASLKIIYPLVNSINQLSQHIFLARTQTPLAFYKTSEISALSDEEKNELANEYVTEGYAARNLFKDSAEQIGLLVEEIEILVEKLDDGLICSECDRKLLTDAQTILNLYKLGIDIISAVEDEGLQDAAELSYAFKFVTFPVEWEANSGHVGIKNALSNAKCRPVVVIEPIYVLSGVGDSGYHFADFSGDGVTDVVQLTGVSVSDWKIWKNNTPKDQINRFNSAFGNYQEVEYKTPQTTELYTREEVDSDITVQELLAPISLATKVTRNNGEGKSRSTQYSYAGFKFHRQGRGFLGASKFASQDILTGAKQVQEYHQSYPYIGVAKSIKAYAKSSNNEDVLVSETTNKWATKNTVNSGNAPYFPYLDKQIQQKYELDGNRYKSVSSSNAYDDYGNLTDNIQYVWPASFNLDINNLPEEGWLSQVVQDNTVDTETGLEDWLISFVTQSKSTFSVNSSNKEDSEKRDLSNREIKVINVPKPGTLAIASTSNYFDDELFQKQDYFYNSKGVVEKTVSSGKDIYSKTETVTSFINGYLPAAITTTGYSGVTPVQKIGYDYAFAQPNIVTDYNGLISTTDYDAFGRAIRQQAGNGVVSTTRYENCENSRCSVSPEASYKIITDTGGAPSTEVFYDQLGREILTRTQQQFLQKWRAIKTEYTDEGYVYRVSLPYTDTTPSYWTTYSNYDGLGRAGTVTQADGGSTDTHYTTLANQQFVSTTENIVLVDGSTDTRVTQSTLDGRGLLVEKTEAKSLGDVESIITLEFDYDAMGNRDWVQVNNVAEETTTSIFDSAGNQLRLNDPDTGTSIYTYNSAGDVLTSQDGGGKKISYSYDALSRITTRTEEKYSDDKLTRWYYDNSRYCQDTNAPNDDLLFIGQLCKVSFSTEEQGYPNYTYHRYDQFGYLAKTINHTRYNGVASSGYNADYDVYGRLKTETLGSGLTLDYDYSNGYLNTVSSKDKILWQATAEDAFGNITEYSLGNGLTGNKQYDVTSGRLIDLEVGESGEIQENHYQWNTDGTLSSRQWQQPIAQTESFTYDFQKRLKTQSGISTRFDKTYNYYANGNIKNQTGLEGDYTYGENEAGPHAVTSVGELAFKYDDAGNLNQKYPYGESSSVRHNISYNSFNKPISIESDTGTTHFDYDNNHKRVFQKFTNNNKIKNYTYYINGGLVEKRYSASGDVIKQITYVGDFAQFTEYGTQAAFNDNTQSQIWHYLHRDHLGSVEVITDIDGNVALDEGKAQRFSYDAFGQPRVELGSISNRGFTDHEHLEESGLIHMNGRVYDPQMSRFLSADILVQAPEFSQSYNRYSYVFNSPLSAIDPSGYATGVLNSASVYEGTDLFEAYYSDYDTGFFPLDALASFGQDVSNSITFGANLAWATLNAAPIAYVEMNGGTIAEADVHIFGMYTSVASGVGAPFLSLFSNPAGTMRLLGRQLRVGVPNNKINMRSPDDLMGVEPASPELLSAVSKKRDVVIAQPGSEELRMLDYFGAEASVGGANNTHILLRQNSSKPAVLEEFLHGTQQKLGITDRLGTSGMGSAETHVKDFMIRHQKMLGLGAEDVKILKTLKDKGL